MVKCSIEIKLMGSAFELIVLGETEDAGNALLHDGINEIRRIEGLLTEFNAGSQTSMLNRQAGIAPVKTDAEVYNLIKRCKSISAITQGAFDISAGVLKTLYNFKRQQVELPPDMLIKKTLKSVGYKYIQLLEDSYAWLSERGMHIGFGAIGKGYAADRVKALWMAKGVKSGVVNASGDLTAWGHQQDGSALKIGIADPDDSAKILLWLPVENASVATSGNYEQYFEWNGARYSHNIDPRTGRPVQFIKSVTVISASAELSDALATAVTVMGPKVGINLVNQLPHVHCIIIDENNNMLQSKNIHTHASR